MGKKYSKVDQARWARERRRRKKLGLPQAKRGENVIKHRLTNSTEHRSWISMMARCYSSKLGDRNFALYQGKGITVCERWHVFLNFLEDMGTKPTPTHTVDRIDSDGNYEPSNCRWATPAEQSRNWKHRNRRIEFNGENLVISDWAKGSGSI